MKKIVSIFVFMLAFVFNANAQEQKTVKELALEDTKLLSEYLEIQGDILNDYTALFEMKHETLLTEGISEERKQVLADVIQAKLFASMPQDQIEKLQLEPTLLEKLKRN